MILYLFPTSFLERKTSKHIPESLRLEFLERFSANNFSLSDAGDNTSMLLNREGIADLPLLRTLSAIRQKSRELSFWEVIDSFLLLAYASLAASRTLFAVITNLSELYFRFRRFILSVQTKKVISINYGSSTSSCKPWRWARLDLMYF